MTVRISDIRRAVAAEYGISLDALMGPDKSRRFARPRQVGMYLSRKLCGRSFMVIAREFGRADHSTVIHAVAKIAALISSVPDLATHVAAIEQKLQRIEKAA